MTEEEKKQKQVLFLKARLRWLYLMVALVLAVSLVGLSLLSIILPDKSFSDQENRMLTRFPTLTAESMKTEKFMKDMESYVADQFAGRDAWITLKTGVDLLLGKREFNNVILGKNNYLMELPAEPDKENVEKNINAINNFYSKHRSVNMDVMIIPNAAYVMKDYLPSGVQVRDQEADAEWLKGMLNTSIDYIDPYEPLNEHRKEGLYYKTDHHWTSRGAMYAFLNAAKKLGIDSPCRSYEAHAVTKSFEGTLASSTGYHLVKDPIDLYVPSDRTVDYYVTDTDNEEKRITIFDSEALNKKDKYQVFLGGNHAQVHIATANRNSRVLLMFKDSYANCFVQFLLPYYSEIFMVDPRYYYDDIEHLIENYDVTDILFLYNMDTFMSDNSLADVLGTSVEISVKSQEEGSDSTAE